MANQISYPDQYIEACFIAWYRAGAPGMMTNNNVPSVGGTEVMKTIPTAPDGRKPALQTVMAWIDKYGWRERADYLDAQVSLTIDKSLVEERKKTLKKLADTGHSLLAKGMEWLNKSENPFGDNASAAVRAIVAATEMIYKYEGAVDKIAAIQQMSDKQLEREIRLALGTDTNENDNTVESTLEDVPIDDADDNA